MLQDTKARFQSSVLDAAAVNLDSFGVTQKQLSALVDGGIRHNMLSNQGVTAAFRSHFSLCCLPGAGAWLTAPPSKDGRSIDGPLFVVALRRRLRMAVFSAESYCPLCGDIMDIWGDHCLSCPCAGDRVVRHNAVRDVIYNDCREAGLAVEREKPGLLPPRSAEEDLPATSSSRRPADVWQARGPSGASEAWDFSVRSGMANRFVERSASSPEEVLALME